MRARAFSRANADASADAAVGIRPRKLMALSWDRPSPLQYQKELRLLEARRLLRTEGASVTTVAYDVGYESSSQFSREYTRKFGVAPAETWQTRLNDEETGRFARPNPEVSNDVRFRPAVRRCAGATLRAPMTNQTQRRIQRRFSLDLAASVSDGVVETKAMTVDASANGLAVRGAWTWAPGSRVTVRLATPRGGAVARALVQRADDDVMGLSLLVLGPRFARLLESSTLAASI